MGTWNVEIRGTITRDIKYVEVEAASMSAAMEQAVALHPAYRAKSATEIDTRFDIVITALARIIAVVDGLGALSEGQLVNIVEMDRVQIRQLIDDGRLLIHANPLTGENGKHIMKQMGLE